MQQHKLPLDKDLIAASVAAVAGQQEAETVRTIRDLVEDLSTPAVQIQETCEAVLNKLYTLFGIHLNELVKKKKEAADIIE